MIPIRFAAFQSPFFTVSHFGNSKKNCKFSGIFGDHANTLIKVGKLNCTVIEGNQLEGFGRLNEETGLYNGVNGIVQRNESDMSLHPISLPPEKDCFKYGPVTEYSHIAIVSSYNLPDSSKDELLDVTSSLSHVETPVWFAYIAFALCFWFLFAFSKKILKRRRSHRSFWTVTTFLFRQCQYDTSGLFNCNIIFFFGLYNQLVHLFLSNYMASDLIRPQIPRVIDTFQDILDLKYNPEYGLVERESKAGRSSQSRNLRPLFTKQTRTFKRFKSAPSDSIEKKVYDHSMKMSNESGPFIGTINLFQSSLEFISHESFNELVVIEIYNVMLFYRIEICKIIAKTRITNPKSSITSKSMWFAKDTISFPAANIYSEQISNSLRKHLDIILIKFAEVGFFINAFADKFNSKYQMSPSVLHCLEDKIDVKLPEVDSIDLGNIYVFMVIICTLLICSAVVLIIEYSIFRTFRRIKPKSNRVLVQQRIYNALQRHKRYSSQMRN